MIFWMIVKLIMNWFLWRYMRIGTYWQMVTYLATMLFAVVLVQVGKRRHLSAEKAVLYVLLFFYIITVYVATVLSREQTSKYLVNLHPFMSWKKAFSGHMFSARLVIENIFLLVPVGITIPLLSRKKPYFLKTVALGFLISLFIESSQYIMRTGLFELDDLINNTIGVLIGCCMVSVCIKIGYVFKKAFIGK